MIDKLTAEGIKIMMMPKAQSWDGKSNLRHQMMCEVDIEDLLPRDKIEVDMNAIGKLLSGRTILITGAAGSIGSEMVKQIAIYSEQLSHVLHKDLPDSELGYLALHLERILSSTIIS